MSLVQNFTTEQRTMLANLYWPGKLARARNGKARYNIRRSAAEKCLLDYYKSQGLFCRNCSGRKGKVCETLSDYYGSVHVEKDDLCLRHSSIKS